MCMLLSFFVELMHQRQQFFFRVSSPRQQVLEGFDAHLPYSCLCWT